MQTMLLHASELSFKHPVIQQKFIIKDKFQVEIKRMLKALKLK